ncbi:metalloprotease [Tilletia horrida]|nr:metalloprotease [Tilletia horrida]
MASSSSSSSSSQQHQQQRTLATQASTAAGSHFPSTAATYPLPGFTFSAAAGASQHSHAVFTKPIEVPSQDKRQYKLIQLPNALQVLLIHDPDTDKASAAMDIKVGHLCDPKELQGLAHYLEHMLFLGTEKYPTENDYHSFLSNHSGSSNAYTGMDNTCYYLDVGPDHLEGALDRFSQFFLKPLFNESCAEREVRAVDSEHKKNLQNDAWRGFQLEKSLSDPAHPYSNFGTGSASTLWDTPRSQGINVREELLKFHERHYSANVMKLVILGRDSLDQLTSWAVDKFSGVPNRSIAPPSFPFSPLGDSQLKTQVFYQTIKDQRALELVFPIPDQGPHFETKPAHIVSHFIGHEGQGSVLSYLKAQGWANSLGASGGSGADGFCFFKVIIDLTPAGLEHYEDVVRSIFRYINLLKARGVEEWAYAEVEQLQKLAFKFAEKMPPASYTSDLASQLQEPYPREWVISGGTLVRKFGVDEIRQTLDCLKPSNCRIFVAAKSIPPRTDAAGAQQTRTWSDKEKWYGTPYFQEPIPDSILRIETEPTALSTPAGAAAAAPAAAVETAASSSTDATDDFTLPTPNSFIPQSLDVPANVVEVASREGYQPALRPLLLRDTPKSRLWYKRDDRFFLPKATVLFTLKNPIIDVTPANAVRSRLLTRLLKDALTEYSYDSLLAGLGYNVDAYGDHVSLSIDGYNDKLPVLFKTILAKLAAFSTELDPQRFELIKEKTRRAYENFVHEAPYQHAIYYTSYLLEERMWTVTEKLQELEGVGLEDFKRYIPEVLARSHLEVLVEGNMERDEAERLVDDAEAILSGGTLHPSELVGRRSLLLPPGSNTIWTKKVFSPDDVNSAVEMYLQIGSDASAAACGPASSTSDSSSSSSACAIAAAAEPTDVKVRSTLALLAQIANEPCFDTLRTKEQLGYIVFSGATRTSGSMGFRVIVQSERSASHLEDRIETFLGATLREILHGMSEAEFERHRASVVQEKREKPKNMWQEASRFWSTIASGHVDFLARARDIEALSAISLADVRAMYDAYVDPRSARRAKLSVHIQSQVEGQAQAQPQAGPRRFGARAADELRKVVEARGGVQVPAGPNGEDPWELLKAQRPSVETVKQFVAQTLGASASAGPGSEEMLKCVDSLAEQFPDDVDPASSAEAAAVVVVKPHIPPVFISEDDSFRYKAELVPSKAPTPVVPLSTLAQVDEHTGGIMTTAGAGAGAGGSGSGSKANL